jgi:hypothetical protein
LSSDGTGATERREDMSEQRPVHTREPAEGAEGDVEGPGAEKAGDTSNPGATDEANAGGFSPMHPQEQAEVGDEDIGAPGAKRSGSGD